MSELLYKETQLDLFENVSSDTLPPETDEKGCDGFDDLVISVREIRGGQRGLAVAYWSAPTNRFSRACLIGREIWIILNGRMRNIHYICDVERPISSR